MSIPPPPPGFVLDESTVPPPGFELDTNRSLRDRWRSAKADPRQRAALAREIGQDFARASYGPRYRDPNLASAAGIAGMVTSPAFLKTALDFAAFGLGSREVQKQARKTFPGMTVDESRIVREEAERLQPTLAPFETAAGAAVGLGTGFIGGTGVLKGAAQGVAKLPGAAQSLIKGTVGKLAFRKATPTAKQVAAGQAVTIPQRAANVGFNLGRGGLAGGGSAAATEMIGSERTAGQIPLASVGLGVALGSAAPFVPAAASAGYKRIFDKKRAAANVIEDKLGAEGAEEAARFYQQTGGEYLPVAAGALNPNAAARMAQLSPGRAEGAVPLQRAEDAMEAAAVARINRDLPADRATGEKIKGAAEVNADAFMGPYNVPGTPGIPYAIVAPEIDQALTTMARAGINRGALNQIATMIRGKLNDATNTIPGDLSINDFDEIRRVINKTNELAQDSVGSSLGFKVRQIFSGPNSTLMPKLEALFQGYDDNVVGGYSRALREAEGANLTPRAFKESPEDFGESVTQRIPPSQLPERLSGLERGMAEELAARTGKTDGGMRTMEDLTPANVSANVARALGPAGEDLTRSAQAYARAGEGVRRLDTPDLPALRRPSAEDFAQAGAAKSSYFPIKIMSDVVRTLTMPKGVRQEVLNLLTDPARSEEAINYMMRAQRRGQMPEFPEGEYGQESLMRLINRTMGRGTSAKAVGVMASGNEDVSNYRGDTRSDPQRRTDDAMGVVNRAVWELRGSGEPMSDEEFYGAEAMMRQMLSEGMGPEAAIEEIIRIHTQ
jgi:hypothetical protein